MTLLKSRVERNYVTEIGKHRAHAYLGASGYAARSFFKICMSICSLLSDVVTNLSLCSIEVRCKLGGHQADDRGIAGSLDRAFSGCHIV
jgi:hypothetical protein